MPSSRTPEKSVRPAPTCEHLHDSASAAPSDKPDEPSPLKSGKLEHEETHLDTAPDGGARAWLVAAGGSAIFFCCLGFSNSFGTFEEYYLSHQLQDKSPSDIAWIGSLSSFLQFAAGMVGGPLFDFFGSWVSRTNMKSFSNIADRVQIIIPSAILYVFALMMLSLCDQYWQIMLVQGVLMGIVMGLLQFPAFAAVSQYFDKKRAAALGVVVSGSSIGGIVCVSDYSGLQVYG
jgi:MFS family permease